MKDNYFTATSGLEPEPLTMEKLVEALEKLQKDLPPEEVAFIYHNQIHRAQLKKIGDLDVASAVIDGRLIHLTVGDWRQFHYEPPLLKAAVNPGS